MGLDATAYESAVLLPVHEHTDDCYEQDHVRAFCYEPHRQSFRGLELSEPYIIGSCNIPFIGKREYLCTGAAVGVHTNYGGHKSFRQHIAMAAFGVDAETVWADPDAYVDAPFFELIHFADNEGCIGPEAAEDLRVDFVRLAEKVVPVLADEVPWCVGKYHEWHKAFEVASGGGLVEFG